jgi:phosphate transport system substrate-binding protein
MIIAVTDTDAYTTISKTPGGVGTTCLTSLITEKPLLNLLTLNGVAATRKNLVSGTYPIFKEINFVTGATTTPEAQKFINFIFSLQGRAIATKTGVYVTAGKKELTSD